MNGRCERCYQETTTTIGSMFNTQMVCMSCKTKENNHPDYEKARDAERKAVQGGNYNYSGIGLPADL